jgi:hypothetical protein
VTITFRLESEDYFDAAQARSAIGRRVRQAGVLTTLVLLFVVLKPTTNVRNGTAFLLLAVLLLGIQRLATWLERRSLKNAFKRGDSDAESREITVEISEQGIQSTDLRTSQEWSGFSKFSESNNAFILYEADSICAILPKRAFDAEGIDRFRRLIQTKLKRF